jgi:hypothetical protein
MSVERRLDGSHWLRYRGPLSAPTPLSRTRAAFRKSFRPTASRTRGTNTETHNQNQTPIPCACRSSLEKTMEADTSIWQKPGHFYFALTFPHHTSMTYILEWRFRLFSRVELFP